jgi:hypothetical protein
VSSLIVDEPRGTPGGARVLASIVIDNYNYARFLGRAIDSALAQTYAHVEVVVVDDGSTDGSQELVARDYGDRVRLVTKDNGGQASAVNRGVAASTGDVVIVLDSDDELHPTTVARVVEVLTPEVAVVHWRMQAVDADGRPLEWTEPLAGAPLDDGSVVHKLVTTGRYASPMMSANAFARWALEQVLPAPEDEFYTSADEYLKGLSALYGPVRAIDEILGSYRVHGANASRPTSLSLYRLRRRTEVDRYRDGHLLRTAARLGHITLKPGAPLPDLALTDQFGMRARIASLRLEPDRHPIPEDRLLFLAGRGAWHALTQARLRPPSRLLFAAWFAVVAVGPLPVARRLITWLYVPSSRPVLPRRGRRSGRPAPTGSR